MAWRRSSPPPVAPDSKLDDDRDAARVLRSMRWREAVILLLASAAIVWIILGTVRSELHQARIRFAEDTLAHLAGQVSLAMHQAAERGEDPQRWTYPLFGPGHPAGGAGTPLAQVLPHGAWIPADPWGRGYRVLLAGEPSRPVPLLVCGGPEDRFDLARPDPRWSQPILWPEPLR